ncbi:MAG TPA: hypothetical protein VGL56_21085 [Fimbriimonadaceae bacterium]|jgi:hypothetical protein
MTADWSGTDVVVAPLGLIFVASWFAGHRVKDVKLVLEKFKHDQYLPIKDELKTDYIIGWTNYNVGNALLRLQNRQTWQLGVVTLIGSSALLAKLLAADDVVAPLIRFARIALTALAGLIAIVTICLSAKAYSDPVAYFEHQTDPEGDIKAWGETVTRSVQYERLLKWLEGCCIGANIIALIAGLTFLLKA